MVVGDCEGGKLCVQVMHWSSLYIFPPLSSPPLLLPLSSPPLSFPPLPLLPSLPAVVVTVLRVQHQTLVTLAARLQAVHEAVLKRRLDYLQYRRAHLNDDTDIFEERRKRKWDSEWEEHTARHHTIRL